MSEAYDPKLQEIAERACAKVGMTVRRGVYIGFNGPSYETPAEITACADPGRGRRGHVHRAGGDRGPPHGDPGAGHLLHHQHGRGRHQKKLHHLEVLEVGEKVRRDLLDVLGGVLPTPRGCSEEEAAPVLAAS